MLKRSLVLAAAIAVGTVTSGGAGVCAAGNCAEQYEFCWETAQDIEGEWRDCCTGFCLGPMGSVSCNNDSNQCRCYDIGTAR